MTNSPRARLGGFFLISFNALDVVPSETKASPTNLHPFGPIFSNMGTLRLFLTRKIANFILIGPTSSLTSLGNFLFIFGTHFALKQPDQDVFSNLGKFQIKKSRSGRFEWLDMCNCDYSLNAQYVKSR